MSKLVKKKAYKKQHAVSNPLFKLTKEESDKLKQPIHDILKRMETGFTDGTDWFNMMFKLMVGKFIIEKFYTEDTFNEFMLTIVACEDIEYRARLVNHTTWVVTNDELIHLQNGIETVDTLQDSHLRLEVLSAFRMSKEYCRKKYVRNNSTT